METASSSSTPRSSLVRRNRSVPLNSDDFLATGFRSRFRRDEFRSVPMGSVDFQQIPGRNFAESTGTFPAEAGPESCRKEIVGTQRSRPKTNGIYRIRWRKQRKQSVPTVGTVDLGNCVKMLHFTVISLPKDDEALIETKQHFLAFELESNKKKLKIIGFVVEIGKQHPIVRETLLD